MRNIVLLSFTPLDAGGGVPRWNKDFIAGFPGTKHYSWDDVVKLNPSFAVQGQNVPEWDKAMILNQWLIWGKRVTKDDIIISDGFWGEGLSQSGYNVISVAHGIWSHLTKEDVDAGKQPEFPYHHAAQVKHRKSHLARGGKIVAVSDFISEQMKLQWGFDSHVINNAIDLDKFKPVVERKQRSIPLVIHGVNDRSNENKGWSHIELLKRDLLADVLSLDEAANARKDIPKYEMMAQADMAVIPSGYEGNSYFCLELLACDVPVVAYNVGLLNSISTIAKENGIQACIGAVMDRNRRSPEETLRVTRFILESVMRDRSTYNPRQVASLFSIQRFHEEWKRYLDQYESQL